MWGLMLRVHGAHVDATVPDFLLNAAATHSAVNQVRRIAHELAARPELYAFDPGANYSVFVQSWDRAELDIPSLAFGRNVVGHSAVGLLSDPYFLDSRGYSGLRRAAAVLPPWNRRSDVIAWRGSVTGTGTIDRPEDIPRIQLALDCRERRDTDVGLLGVHSTMRNVLAPGALADFVASHGLVKDGWPMADFGRHKFVFDVDGHANAWGLLEKFILGCCVLKVASPFEQWYYDRLKPWQHYVPLKADLSNLAEIIDWCRDHDEQCRWIAANGARLAASLTIERDLPSSCRTLLSVAHVQRSAAPQLRRDRDRRSVFPLLVEDAIHRAEAAGDINGAIAGYAQLVKTGAARTDSAIRYHELLRQQGQYARALCVFEEAATNDPDSDEASLRLAQFLALIGRDMRAVEHLNVAIRAAPQRAEVRITLAASCLKLGWIDRAFQAVRDLPEDLPGWWADVRRQALDEQARRRCEARAILAARRAAGAMTPERRLQLAHAFFALGKLGAADRLCRTAMDQSPDLFAPVLLAGRIVARRAGATAALNYLQSSKVTIRIDSRFQSEQARLLFERADYARALEVLSATPAVEQERADLATAALSQILLGETAALRKHCSAWMERAPEDMLPAELVCAGERQSSIDAQRPGADIALLHYWHDEHIPEDVSQVMETWTTLHPGLRRELYCEESARAFLLSGCDAETLRAFDACVDAAAKAAFFRYAWLHSRGGVAIDADQSCVRSAEDWLAAAAASEIAVVRSGYITGYLDHRFVGGRAGSRPVESALRRATQRILEAGRLGHPIWNWAAVGSGLLTRVVAEHICEADGAGGALLMMPFTYQSFAVNTDALAYKERARSG